MVVFLDRLFTRRGPQSSATATKGRESQNPGRREREPRARRANQCGNVARQPEVRIKRRDLGSIASLTAGRSGAPSGVDQRPEEAQVLGPVNQVLGVPLHRQEEPPVAILAGFEQAVGGERDRA